jgi:hypothetical protein
MKPETISCWRNVSLVSCVFPAKPIIVSQTSSPVLYAFSRECTQLSSRTFQTHFIGLRTLKQRTVNNGASNWHKYMVINNVIRVRTLFINSDNICWTIFLTMKGITHSSGIKLATSQSYSYVSQCASRQSSTVSFYSIYSFASNAGSTFSFPHNL